MGLFLLRCLPEQMESQSGHHHVCKHRININLSHVQKQEALSIRDGYFGALYVNLICTILIKQLNKFIFFIS